MNNQYQVKACLTLLPILYLNCQAAKRDYEINDQNLSVILRHRTKTKLLPIPIVPFREGGFFTPYKGRC